MKYSDFFVIPETDLDEKFVDEEIKFLIDKSIYKREEFKNKHEYAKSIRAHYDSWLYKNISVG